MTSGVNKSSLIAIIMLPPPSPKGVYRKCKRSLATAPLHSYANAVSGCFHAVGVQACLHGQFGLDHGIGHLMLVEVDSEAQAVVPPRPKSRQTSTAASDRKTSRLLSSRQAASGKSCEWW